MRFKTGLIISLVLFANSLNLLSAGQHCEAINQILKKVGVLGLDEYTDYQICHNSLPDIENANDVLYIESDGEVLVGFIVFDKEGPEISIERIGVAEGSRKKGLASKMLEKLYEKYRPTLMSAGAANEVAADFFARNGFIVSNPAKMWMYDKMILRPENFMKDMRFALREAETNDMLKFIEQKILSGSYNEKGQELYEQACQKGLETLEGFALLKEAFQNIQSIQ
ncbi:MAG: GNAT family N-acetyltransferase [Candidatus Babeliales bacterium]|jgi:GNAT superfamily N-acetyltransferase